MNEKILIKGNEAIVPTSRLTQAHAGERASTLASLTVSPAWLWPLSPRQPAGSVSESRRTMKAAALRNIFTRRTPG